MQLWSVDQPCHVHLTRQYCTVIMGVGRGSGGTKAPLWILKSLAKKVVFSISRGENQISTFLAPPEKNFGKIPYWPTLEKILPTPMLVMCIWPAVLHGFKPCNKAYSEEYCIEFETTCV